MWKRFSKNRSQQLKSTNEIDIGSYKHVKTP